MTKIIRMTIPTRTRDPEDCKRTEVPNDITERKFSPKEFEMQEGYIINFCNDAIPRMSDTLAVSGIYETCMDVVGVGSRIIGREARDCCR